MLLDNLLLFLSNLNYPFTSKLVSKKLGISKSKSSLSLMRLYRRDLLSRRINARNISIGYGFNVNRGIEYLYSINAKGQSRIKWLRIVKPRIEAMENYFITELLKGPNVKEFKLFLGTVPQHLSLLPRNARKQVVRNAALNLSSDLLHDKEKLESKIELKERINRMLSLENNINQNNKVEPDLDYLKLRWDLDDIKKLEDNVKLKINKIESGHQLSSELELCNSIISILEENQSILLKNLAESDYNRIVPKIIESIDSFLKNNKIREYLKEN
jgi:hypothetical protein